MVLVISPVTGSNRSTSVDAHLHALDNWLCRSFGGCSTAHLVIDLCLLAHQTARYESLGRMDDMVIPRVGVGPGAG